MQRASDMRQGGSGCPRAVSLPAKRSDAPRARTAPAARGQAGSAAEAAMDLPAFVRVLPSCVPEAPGAMQRAAQLKGGVGRRIGHGSSLSGPAGGPHADGPDDKGSTSRRRARVSHGHSILWLLAETSPATPRTRTCRPAPCVPAFASGRALPVTTSSLASLLLAVFKDQGLLATAWPPGPKAGLSRIRTAAQPAPEAKLEGRSVDKELAGEIAGSKPCASSAPCCTVATCGCGAAQGTLEHMEPHAATRSPRQSCQAFAVAMCHSGLLAHPGRPPTDRYGFHCRRHTSQSPVGADVSPCCFPEQLAGKRSASFTP